MVNITTPKIIVDVTFVPFNGCEITFCAPGNCTQVSELQVRYPSDEGTTSSLTFKFTDAHGNDVGGRYELFKAGAMVKVILDTVNSKAFVQNGDTNAYLEQKLEVKSGIAEYFVQRPNGNDSHSLEFHRQVDTLYLVGTLIVTQYLGSDGLYSDKTFYLESSITDDGFFKIREKTVVPLTCVLEGTSGAKYHMYAFGEFNTDGSIRIYDIPPKELYDETIRTARVYVNITYMYHAVG